MEKGLKIRKKSERNQEEIRRKVEGRQAWQRKIHAIPKAVS